MPHLSSKSKEILITLNVEELTPVQVRLLKSVSALLTTVLSAEDESEYFEASAELMKKTTDLIKKSSFPKNHQNMNYAEQAVEYAMDFLGDTESKDNFDN